MAETTNNGTSGPSKPLAGESRKAYQARIAKLAKVQAATDWALANPAAAKSGKVYTWANVPSRWADLADAEKLDEMAGQAVYFTTGVTRVKAIIKSCPCGDDRSMIMVQAKVIRLFDELAKALA